MSAAPTRRALPGRAAVAAPAAGPHPDAALLALERTIREADDECARVWAEHEARGRDIGALDDPRMPAAVARVHAAIDAMGRLPALTPAGLLAKARVVRGEVTVGCTGHGDDVAETLVADLERLAATAGRN